MELTRVRKKEDNVLIKLRVTLAMTLCFPAVQLRVVKSKALLTPVVLARLNRKVPVKFVLLRGTDA